MICEVCKKNHADIVFKTVTDGQVATRAMCLSCAHTVQQDIMRMFMNLGSAPDGVQETEETAAPRAEAPRFVCAGCGRPFAALDEHTLAGCARCYDAMEEELADHFHMEEMPVRMDIDQASEEETNAQELRIKLMEAIIREDYEQAAVLRNQLAGAAHGAEGKA
ncbi:MAG TPA: hypothetical protein VLA21_07210 [Candidatus Limnocylindria bacterium]|nr:hypothetical protein [Candidatus Limnocylindria bacterium]